MNITLLQNSCKKLDPHTGVGQTTSKPLACRIMNWISLPSTLTAAIFCCSAGGTLDINHYLLSVNKPFHWCHVDLPWSCAPVLEGTVWTVVTQIPLAHAPVPGQLCFCYSLLQPAPDDSLDSTTCLRESKEFWLFSIFMFRKHSSSSWCFLLALYKNVQD